MTDREKLIDLRREGEKIAENFCVSKQECYQCPYNTPNGCQEGLIADHILASDFINELQNEAYDLGVDSALHNHFGLSWEDAAGLRKEITRLQDATKWIPVTERLPDSGIEVLAMLKVNKFDGHDAHNVTTAVIMPSGSWLVADYQEGIEAETAGTDCEDCCYWITHWMPLPKPPKGE